MEFPLVFALGSLVNLPVELVAIEAAATLGWDRYAGIEGKVLGMERFGASAPYKVLAEKFGFTRDKILETARSLFR